jgi:uncharacterized membrane protein
MTCRRQLLTFAAVAQLTATGALASHSTPELLLLGDAPGGPVFSDAQAVSPDGEFVVGVSRDALGEIAFRWSRAGGLVTLGRLSNATPNSQALAVSADGSVAGGFASTSRGPGEPVLYFADGSINNIRGLRGSLSFGSVTGLSTTGVFACGSSVVGGAFNFRAWRYSPETGVVDLGVPTGFTDAQASGISPEGSCVVGLVGTAFFQTSQPFIWRRSTGVVPLGNLPGGLFASGEARSCSAYGRTVVGHSYSARANPEAFRYTTRGGMVGLGDLPGGTSESYARGVSADGVVIVGISSTGTTATPIGQEAFYWTAFGGLRRLADVATEAGLDLQGFVFERAQAVNADGTVIVGSGRFAGTGDTQAFLLRLPLPRRTSDFNSDGVTNIDDIFIYLNDWFLGLPRADFNAGGVVNIDDIFIFLNAWFAASP